MAAVDNSPLISLALAVFNGAATLDRSIRSVLAQTFADWELVAVDDCSTDDGYEALQAWAAKDHRIRVLRTEENYGPGAARNLALRAARGRFIAYLDHDDEFYPDYLAQVARHRDKGDVLVFEYDVVRDRLPDPSSLISHPSSLAGRESDARGVQARRLNEGEGEFVRIWRSGMLQDNFFVADIAVPLGVAHRRELLQKTGGFNELLPTGEDTDLWRRFARAGAEFIFLPLKSGRYHILPGSRSRKLVLKPWQQERIAANRQAGRPVYEDGGAGIGSRPPSPPAPLPKGEGSIFRTAAKIAFASPYCLADFTSGAAVATAHALRFLAGLGFQCRAFCGPRIEAGEEIAPEDLLARQGATCQTKAIQVGGHTVRLLVTALGGVPLTIFRTASSRGVWASDAEQAAFYRAYAMFLDQDRPDALVTYGGDPAADTLMRLAKRRDIPVVFALHNFSYSDPGSFKLADYVIVPSEFSRQYHWEHLGLACHTLPYIIDWERVEVPQEGDSPIFPAGATSSNGQTPCAARIGTVPGGCHPQYVTFVNPQPTKGVYVFARIAEELARRRPDIPLLVVEGRGRAGMLAETGIDLARLGNVRTMANTPDPREFYAVSKLLIMPSLWNESFGLVAAEAMLNGIPVLASNRGALPETLGVEPQSPAHPHPGPLPEGEGGYVLDIPAQYTPKSRTLPTVEEVQPWVETIERLWDDAEFYRRSSEAARGRAECWRPERLAGAYRDFFGNITPQPGPPIVPRSAGAPAG